MDHLPGFLGTRASLMLDVVVLAMVVILPALGWSVWLVRYRRRFLLHKRVQLAMGAVLLVAVAAFEIDMRLFTDWRKLAEPSPYYPRVVDLALYVHLGFSISTTLLWLYVTAWALRHIPSPPAPSPASGPHIFWARLAAWDLVATAVTGWLFYWLAFVR
jgi:hypothetical protein